MAEWTASRVEEWLEAAANVLKRLPEERVRGYASAWPPIVHDLADQAEQEPVALRRPPPSASAITRMDEAMVWLAWLDPTDAKLVWLRASGHRWKAVCWKLGISRATAHRHWLYALSVIAWRLNAGFAPARQSRLSTVKVGPVANT